MKVYLFAIIDASMIEEPEYGKVWYTTMEVFSSKKLRADRKKELMDLKKKSDKECFDFSFDEKEIEVDKTNPFTWFITE